MENAMGDLTLKSQIRSRYLTFFILSIVPLMGMGIDLYAPSLPWMTSALHATPALIKLTIAMYLFGYAIGPIFGGTFSDIYGRRPILILGAFLYLFACVIVLLLPAIHLMLGMRFLQGIGAGLMAVCFRAMMTDSYDSGKDIQKMGAQVSAAWAVGPIIAPFIGGYLQHYFGWEANFVFFIIYATIALLVGFLIPETNQQKHFWNARHVLQQYRDILSHRIFWACVICMGAVYSMIVFFNVVGPFFIQNILHYNPVRFGYIALLMGFAFFLGNLLNRALVEKYDLRQLMQVGIALSLLGFTVLLVLGYLFRVNLYAYIIPIFFSILCSALIFPNAMSTVTSLFPKMAGAAGAMVGLIFSGITALATVFASYLQSGTQVPVAYAYIIAAVVTGLFFYGLMYRHLSDKTTDAQH